MIEILRSDDRGGADHGWLQTRHSFSFADYYDPDRMGFRSLRVINEDHIRGGTGFGEHPHRDMEIVTYLVSGSLRHGDSMGNGSVLRPGDVQRMTAGTGVRHSEMNGSADETTHLLQIWILPERQGLEPGYEERHVSDDEKRGRLARIASRRPANGELKIHQDVDLFAAVLEPGQSVEHALDEGRHAWVQVIRGDVELNGQALAAGDGAAVRAERTLALTARTDAELLLFDLA